MSRIINIALLHIVLYAIISLSGCGDMPTYCQHFYVEASEKQINVVHIAKNGDRVLIQNMPDVKSAQEVADRLNYDAMYASCDYQGKTK